LGLRGGSRRDRHARGQWVLHELVGSLPAGQEGFEYHLLAIALAGIVALRASGAWSVDRALGAGRTAVRLAARQAVTG
jgi:hypothetical protein